MAYFTDKHLDALVADPAALRELSAKDRVEIALRHQEIENARKERFWNAISAFAAAIPILAVLGVVKWKDR